MRAMILDAQTFVETNPLRLRDVPDPQAGPGEIRLRVSACGICRTDLHVIEGDLAPHRMPIIPGHQIVGTVDQVGAGVTRFVLGDRAGVPWLHKTCGVCKFCASGRENLCGEALFTGYDADGGYAEYAVAPADFSYKIPDGFSDLNAAPLLCAGIIGYRSLRLTGVKPGARLGMVGFGASAHVTIQVARHLGIMDIYVISVAQSHLKLASELGAVWTGRPGDDPPVKLDAAIIFAPAGETVPMTLKLLEKGGVLVLAGIHMTDIPPIRYADLWGERVIRSVANLTREDGDGLLAAAAAIPIRTRTHSFPLDRANEALIALKQSKIDGAGVIVL